MRNGPFFMLAFFACGPESAWEPLRVDRAVCGYRGARAVLSRLMSRLRKEVLASRVGNGEDAAALAAPVKQRGPRGLAMKEGRMKVPMGVRSETRSLEAETHDLERQLDNLRVQMAMEKERQQTLV